MQVSPDTMTETMTTADRGVLWAMAVLIAAWAISGALDVKNRTEAGLETDGNYVITHLVPGGPAESVNMQLGDRIVRIDSTEVNDAANIVRLPRVEPGERRNYTVVRAEETIRYRPAFRTLDLRSRTLEYLSTIVGLAFLLIPLVACMTRLTGATRVLALMGLGLSFSFFDGPYIVNYEFRAVAVCVAQLFMLLGLAAMLHFLLLFPQMRPILKRSWGKKLLYIPALIIWLLIAWRVLFTPSSDSLAAFVSQFFSGLGTTVYLVIGLFLLLRGYSRTDRGERKRLALNRMLWATVAAVIPTVVAQLASIVSPDTPLPAQDYYFVLLALIPITWSLSASRTRPSAFPG